MTYPPGPGSQGVPPQYLGGGQWVPDPRYQGGGWWSYPARGTHLTEGQLQMLWIEAGGRSELAPLMAKVAIRESGGWSAAWNSTGATGPWQIEWPGSSPSGWSRERLFIPAENAKAAVALSGNSLSGIEAHWQGDVQAVRAAGGAGPLNPSSAGQPATAGMASGCVPGMLLLPLILPVKALWGLHRTR